MSEDTSTFSMRLPSSIRERLGVLAKANHHRVNAEAVARLARSVDGATRAASSRPCSCPASCACTRRRLRPTPTVC